MKKPLGRKAYGSIPHLPGSRLGSGDHCIELGQAKILTKKSRPGDNISVQDKFDGSNVAVAKLQDDRIVALGRSGYLAESSPYLQHHLFSDWVYSQYDRFYELLQPGEWVSGEWLAQAHGTRYELRAEPFVAFDLFHEGKRILLDQLVINRLVPLSFRFPLLLKLSANPISIEEAIKLLDAHNNDQYISLDPREGAVWRCENEKNGVEFLAKYVRHDKVDGKYLPEFSGEIIWNENLFEFLPDKAIKRIKDN